MKYLIDRTFRAIPRDYYLRHFYLSLIVPTALLWVLQSLNHFHFQNGVYVALFFAPMCALAPYAHWAADRLLAALKGNHILVVHPIAYAFFLFFKYGFCCAGAIYLAPFGLVNLYFASGKTRP